MKQTFLSIIVLFSFTFSVVGQGLPSQPNILTLHTGPLVAQVSNIVTNNDSLDINLVDDNKNIIAKLEAWDSKDVRLDSTLSDKEILAVFDSSSNRYKVNRLYPPKFTLEPSVNFYLSQVIGGIHKDTSYITFPESQWYIDSSSMFRRIAVLTYEYSRPADLQERIGIGNNYREYMIYKQGEIFRLIREEDTVSVYLRDDYARHKEKSLAEFIQHAINDFDLSQVLQFKQCPELDYDLVILKISYQNGIERPDKAMGVVTKEFFSRTLVMRDWTRFQKLQLQNY